MPHSHLLHLGIPSFHISLSQVWRPRDAIPNTDPSIPTTLCPWLEPSKTILRETRKQIGNEECIQAAQPSPRLLPTPASPSDKTDSPKRRAQLLESELLASISIFLSWEHNILLPTTQTSIYFQQNPKADFYSAAHPGLIPVLSFGPVSSLNRKQPTF